MKIHTKHGFTLIELLVVVLIIGILSAVALPQYTKAVEKSRAAEALSIVRTLIQAQEAYYLSNGEYSDDINMLDVEIPGTDNTYGGVSRRESKWFSYALRARTGEHVIANRLPVDTLYVIMADGTKIWCRGYSSEGVEVCKTLGNQKIEDKSYESYQIS